MDSKMLRVFVFLLVACALSSESAVQSSAQRPRSTVHAAAQEAADKATMQSATQGNYQLTVVSNVADSADIQAVLIPADLANRIFGKEVSDHYAVVELVVANKDANSSMVLHNVFLDYSNWLLSGLPPNRSNSLGTNQKENLPSQVASVESRLVRGEMLDAQQWSKRNWTIRTLTLLGTTATAFEFPFTTDVIKGIGAFNGTVVPGVSSLWPDGTISQTNRISDFGFQTNKIIAKQDAELIVAFFPIKRFLTPTFAKVFRHDAAAWFVPKEMLADPKTQKQFVDIVFPIYAATHPEATRDGFVKAAWKNIQDPKCQSNDDQSAEIQSQCSLINFMNGVSLNNIRVVVQGVMTVDVKTVPATVYGISCGTGTNASLWTTLTNQSCSVSGVYLTGGIPSLVDASGKPIPGATLSSVASGSTDTNLNFTLKLTQCVTSATKAFLVVSKTGANADAKSASGFAASASGGQSTAGTTGSAVSSTPFEISPQPDLATCPSTPADTNTPAGNAAKQAREKKPGL